MKFLDVPQSGSVAGVTSSHNRFGQYRRTRAMPVQPRSPRQTANRALLTVGSSAWRGLTDAEREAWSVYASQIARSDSLGSSYSPTGSMLYTGAAILALGFGLTDAPSELPTYILAVTGITYTDPTPGPEALTVTTAATLGSNTMTVETSGPISPGITSSAGVKRWRTLPQAAGSLSPNQFGLGSTSIDILTQYKFLFPSPIVGQSIWFRFSEQFFATNGSGVTNQSKPTLRLIIP